MRYSHTLFMLLIIILSLNHRPALATIAPVPALDVSRLTSEASIIAVGAVTSIREEECGNFEIRGQLIPACRMTASFRAARVLKGEAAVELSFRFFSPDQPVGFASLTAEQFGMFFFRSSSEGVVLVSPYHPFIVAARQGCRANSNGLTGVVTELECVLQSPVTSTRERAEAIGGLTSVKTADANSVLTRASRVLPAPLNILAAFVLLSRNDISVLPLIEQALQHTPVLVIEDVGYRLETNLCVALGYIKDPAAIPALTRLSEVADVKTRRGAVSGLRNVGTEATVEPLSKALYDSDWEVRWVAVMGLAGIIDEGGSWYPAYDEFRRNEQHYLNHWRERVRRR